MLIQKPGTLITSIDQELWQSHGKQVYDQDRQFIYVVNLSSNPKHDPSLDCGVLPDVFKGLL